MNIFAMIGINVRNQQPGTKKSRTRHCSKIIINFYLLLFIYILHHSMVDARYKLYILTAFFYMIIQVNEPVLMLVIKVIAVVEYTNRLSP